MNSEEILNKYRKKIFNVVLRDARNPVDVEDLFQEVFTYICEELKDKKKCNNIRNLDSWVLKVTENFCKRYYKKMELEIKNKSEADIYDIKDEEEQYQPETRYIKKETPRFYILEHLNPEIKEGLEISLEWIKRFYMLKEIVKSVLTEYRPIFDALDILTSTKEKIKRKLPLTKDKAKVLAEKYRHRAVKYQKIYTEKKRLMKEDISMIRFKEMSESEQGRIQYIDLTKVPSYCLELDDDTKEKFKFGIHTELDYLIEATKSMIGANLIFKELLDIFWFSSPIKEDFKEFITYIPSMRINPGQLIFMVWHRAFRKGQYTDLMQIKELLLAFKDENKGTGKEFLFANLNDSININNLRVAFHRNYKKKEYRMLSDLIYKKSFIKKISPSSYSD